ncbi:MAG: T9SS type A sorting domain-containing protein [Bacteroidetes bacterium]|nr:T9SS type A sorting domain-containing protein [Bacteroidota bacterium]
MSFTSNLSYTSTVGFIGLTPHVYEFGKLNIIDTLNWTKINGIYKANGTEQYITIGNFRTDLISKVDTTNYNLNCPGAYYFIDDVSVEPICTPFWSYRDTTLAIGQDSVLIGPAITGLNINWYDATSTFITNAPGIYVKPAQTTTYTAVEDFCGTTYTSTIVVTVQPTGVNEFGMTKAELRIFPNPTTGKLKFVNNNLIDTEQLQIKICDLLGREIKQMEYKEEIDISNLENGVYFLSFYKNSQLLIIKKVIKQ